MTGKISHSERQRGEGSVANVSYLIMERRSIIRIEVSN